MFSPEITVITNNTAEESGVLRETGPRKCDSVFEPLVTLAKQPEPELVPPATEFYGHAGSVHAEMPDLQSAFPVFFTSSDPLRDRQDLGPESIREGGRFSISGKSKVSFPAVRQSLSTDSSLDSSPCTYSMFSAKPELHSPDLNSCPPNQVEPSSYRNLEKVPVSSIESSFSYQKFQKLYRPSGVDYRQYGHWSSAVWRGLQDRFGLSMKHVRMVQDILTEAKVPMRRPFTAVHVDSELRAKLGPILLKYLLGHTLMDSSTIRKPVRPEFVVICYPNSARNSEQGKNELRHGDFDVVRYMCSRTENGPESADGHDVLSTSAQKNGGAKKRQCSEDCLDSVQPMGTNYDAIPSRSRSQLQGARDRGPPLCPKDQTDEKYAEDSSTKCSLVTDQEISAHLAVKKRSRNRNCRSVKKIRSSKRRYRSRAGSLSDNLIDRETSVDAPSEKGENEILQNSWFSPADFMQLMVAAAESIFQPMTNNTTSFLPPIPVVPDGHGGLAPAAFMGPGAQFSPLSQHLVPMTSSANLPYSFPVGTPVSTSSVGMQSPGIRVSPSPCVSFPYLCCSGSCQTTFPACPVVSSGAGICGGYPAFQTSTTCSAMFSTAGPVSESPPEDRLALGVSWEASEVVGSASLSAYTHEESLLTPTSNDAPILLTPGDGNGASLGSAALVKPVAAPAGSARVTEDSVAGTKALAARQPSPLESSNDSGCGSSASPLPSSDVNRDVKLTSSDVNRDVKLTSSDVNLSSIDVESEPRDEEASKPIHLDSDAGETAQPACIVKTCSSKCQLASNRVHQFLMEDCCHFQNTSNRTRFEPLHVPTTKFGHFVSLSLDRADDDGESFGASATSQNFVEAFLEVLAKLIHSIEASGPASDLAMHLTAKCLGCSATPENVPNVLFQSMEKPSVKVCQWLVDHGMSWEKNSSCFADIVKYPMIAFLFALQVDGLISADYVDRVMDCAAMPRAE